MTWLTLMTDSCSHAQRHCVQIMTGIASLLFVCLLFQVHAAAAVHLSTGGSAQVDGLAESLACALAMSGAHVRVIHADTDAANMWGPWQLAHSFVMVFKGEQGIMGREKSAFAE